MILLVGFVYSDAKRRNMRYVVWTFLAALIPDGIGIILYFLLRDPLPLPCPRCNSLVPHSYSFCPHCGTQIVRACPSCRRKIETGLGELRLLRHKILRRFAERRLKFHLRAEQQLQSLW